MPNNVMRHCPRCGKRPIDRLVMECPDCKVPFASDSGPGAVLTPEQLRLLAGLVLTSWKFWLVLAVMVGAVAWGISQVAERMIDLRAQAYLNTLEQKATNHIAFASTQISNQIALELRQPPDQGRMIRTGGLGGTARTIPHKFHLARVKRISERRRAGQHPACPGNH